MNIDKFNSEGCGSPVETSQPLAEKHRPSREARHYDPTSYEAMTNVAKADKQSAFRPLVYICSPFSGDTERNSEQARKYSRFAYEQNTIPVTPHLLYPQFMNDENQKERADAMHFNYVLLGKCNEMWVFGDVISKGMAHEIGIAKKRQQTVSVNIHSWKAVENWHWITPDFLKSM